MANFIKFWIIQNQLILRFGLEEMVCVAKKSHCMDDSHCSFFALSTVWTMVVMQLHECFPRHLNRNLKKVTEQYRLYSDFSCSAGFAFARTDMLHESFSWIRFPLCPLSSLITERNVNLILKWPQYHLLEQTRVKYVRSPGRTGQLRIAWN